MPPSPWARADASPGSGVPGELRGTEHVHSRYGKLPWAHVLASAIRLARHGFTVSEDLVRYMDAVSPNRFLTDDPAWAVDFAPRGSRVRLGEIMTHKRYADMLETIASQGADAFYTGAVAKATIAALADLANYTVAVQEPLAITYRGFRLTSCNAPSSGAVALSALNTVGGYCGFGDPAQVNLTTHRLDEAMCFAYGQRAELGDPAFVPGLAEYTWNMVAPEMGADVRSRISDLTTHDVAWYDT